MKDGGGVVLALALGVALYAVVGWQVCAVVIRAAAGVLR